MIAPDYESLYLAANLNKNQIPIIEETINEIQANKERYIDVADRTRVPWYVIAAIHSLESNLNFNCHLHNGDPLTNRTIHVPTGRPVYKPENGKFPYTWEESAIDAIARSDLWFPSNSAIWTIAESLAFLEKYNGLGYLQRGINTPYLWNFTNLYQKGLFISDNEFDPNAVSESIGAAALFKVMQLKGLIVQGENNETN